jgi:serine/threonine protein kinase/tetratricopeptide (TPR) repeat protein
MHQIMNPPDNPPVPLNKTIVLDPAAGIVAARSLKRELLEEQRAAWEQGVPKTPEEMLARWPTNADHDPDVASLLFEDFLQRRRQGDQPSVDDYEERFPAHKHSLAKLISRQEVLRSVGGDESRQDTLSLPEVGDELFGFRLCHELGRGAFARVFLAEQANLAGRPVVLKVSGIAGSEPQTLAQLQHTHIVPIYSVHEDPRAGLRAVCMPYFGGASLSAVLRALGLGPSQLVHGKQLAGALDDLQAGLPDLWKAVGVQKRGHPSFSSLQGTKKKDVPFFEPQPLAMLRGESYLRAAVWITARLAEALQHAHERGILHRDIKPSNILLAGDGQPLLLDFNLAQDAGQDPAHASLGGTVAYMAPEHLRALLARKSGQVRPVDHRSDIYSLGMVLFEMLTGHSPFDQSGSYSVLPVMIEAMALERSQSAPSLRQRRGDVPWSLESICRKCLAPDPENRYQQAEHLADDLRRFLEDRPLRYAPELSWAERLRKWLRRHPRVTSSGSVAALAAVILLAAGASLLAVRGHLAGTQEQLQLAESQDRQRAYEAGTVRALCLVNTVNDLQDHLQQGLEVCRNTLGLYDVLDRADWEEHPHWQRLEPEARHRLAENTRELLLLLAWARVRLNPKDPAALRDALGLLERAEAIGGLGQSRALWIDRAYYLERLGEQAQSLAARRKGEALQPATAQDHYLLAATYARRGTAISHAKAVAELDQALVLNPHHYWAHVQRGICHQEQGEHTLAAGDFGACIGLWPEFAWGHFNRGYALDRSGRKQEAIQDYSAALERDPSFLLAYVNRGLARLELKQYEPALADLEQAQRRGRDDAFVHAGRGMALEALGRHVEADAAFQVAFARAGTAGEQGRLRLHWVYGFAVAERLPQKAQQAFDAVLREDSQQPQALYGRAMLAAKQKQLDEAINFFNRALDADPGFLDARRFRAILLARRGDFGRASQDINACLEREPKQGSTLYAAACVVSRMAEKSPERQTLDQALDLLEKALAQGYGLELADTDPDLAALRKHPEFTAILSRMRERGKER